MEPSYLFALTTGLLGGAHCVGMCGPLVASCTLHDGTAVEGNRRCIRDAVPHLLYNLGRIMSYAFIGTMMGASGSFLSTAAGVRSAVPFVAGAFMILMGMNITGLLGGVGWLEKKGGSITRLGKVVLMQHSQWKYYILGALFGFLPCGLSYSVFMAAAGTGSPGAGMMLSLFFGVGTVPWLLLFGVAVHMISSRMRGVIYRFAGVLVIIMGILFLVRGVHMHG